MRQKKWWRELNRSIWRLWNWWEAGVSGWENGQESRGPTELGSQNQSSGQPEQTALYPLLLLPGNMPSIHPLPAYPVAQDSVPEDNVWLSKPKSHYFLGEEREGLDPLVVVQPHQKGPGTTNRGVGWWNHTHTYTQMTKACCKCADSTCVCVILKPLNLGNSFLFLMQFTLSFRYLMLGWETK